MAIQLAVVKAIAEAVKEGAKVWNTWLASADKRRMAATIKRQNRAIEAAESYIDVDMKTGQYKDITDDRKEKLKIHFTKRFKRFNN